MVLNRLYHTACIFHPSERMSSQITHRMQQDHQMPNHLQCRIVGPARLPHPTLHLSAVTTGIAHKHSTTTNRTLAPLREMTWTHGDS